MVLLTCHCLNIQVHTRGSEIKLLDINSLNLTVKQLKDPFFSKDIANVVLDICGITKEQPYLVQNHIVGDWIIHTCIACNEVVFASHIHQGVDHLLVNADLQRDPTHVKQMMLSKDYSSLFKIRLQKKDDNRIFSCQDYEIPKSQQSKTLEAALTSIQQQITKYLQAEQKAVDERIRKFTDQQHNEFSNLRACVQQEKVIVMSLLLSVEEKKLSEAISEAMLEQSDFTPSETLANNKEDIISSPAFNKLDNVEKITVKSDKVKSAILKSNNLPKHPLRKTMHKSQPVRNRVAMSLDSDAIFPIDGLHDDLSSSSSSEENESEDTEDNYGASGKARTHPLQISASLPMAIPHNNFTSLQRAQPQKHEIEYEDEDRVPNDPAEIVASIKAMSMSVHDTEIFGELPPPRVNNSPNK